jgi:nucleoside-diphosphate-sugar epimerase
MLLCDRPGAPSGTFNITNGEPIRVRDLLQKVFLALGQNVTLRPAPYRLAAGVAGAWQWTARSLRLEREPRLLPYALGLMRYSQTLDIAAARTQLGYTPQATIDEGLQQFARWYERGRPDWFGDINPQSPEHHRARG